MSPTTATVQSAEDSGSQKLMSPAALRALAWGLLGTGATLTALGFMTVLTLPVVATVAAGLLLMLGVGMKRASAGRVREAVASARETDRKIDRIERMLDEVL